MFPVSRVTDRLHSDCNSDQIVLAAGGSIMNGLEAESFGKAEMSAMAGGVMNT